MRKVLFCIPTLFNKPERTIRCIQNLLNQCEKNDIEYKIFVVNNIEEDLFSQWDPGIPEVNKLVSGELYNVGKALNTPIQHYESDYYAFLQDDMFFHDDKWIDNCIKIYETQSLNCGVIGSRPHSTNQFYCKPVEDSPIYKLDDVLWTDGVMFFSTKMFKEVGLWDENYYGDCESQDFCYKVKKAGYTNYRAYIEQTHEAGGFHGKVDMNQYQGFSKKVEESRKLLHERWDSWQDEIVNKS